MKLRLLICALFSGMLVLLTGCMASNAGELGPPRVTYQVTMLDKDTVQAGGQTMPADQLPAFLQANGIDPQRTNIVVHGKNDTPIRDIRRITQMLNRANYRNTTFSSLR